MITGQLKRDIDKLWLEFWQGGITNPLTVIEQITFLMFIRLLDIQETADERRAARSPNYQFKRRFKENEQELRWKNVKQCGSIDALLPLVRDKVFKQIRELAAPDVADGHGVDNERTFASLMKDAQLMIVKPSLLARAIAMIDDLPLTEGDRKGDLYEYLLSKLTTAGINGQFRTPRHLIDLMVEMIDPKPSESIAKIQRVEPAAFPGAVDGGILKAKIHIRDRTAEGTRSRYRRGYHHLYGRHIDARAVGPRPKGHVSRARFRRDDAAARSHELDAAWRRGRWNPLWRHAVFQLWREQPLRRHYGQSAFQRVSRFR